MTKNSGVTGKTVNQLARQLKAQQRQTSRAERTTAQQLALLDKRPGRSLKERTRLCA